MAEGQREYDDVIKKALSRYNYGIEGWSYILEEFEEDLKFANGDQWPDDIRADRDTDERPSLTSNRLPAFIRQVIGDVRQNKPRIKISPVDDYADPDTAEVIEGLVRNIEHTSKADIAYHTAAYYAAAGGLGYIHVTRDYASNDVFEQDIKIKRVLNVHSVILDPSIEEPDGADAQWGFITEWVPKEEFAERFPDAEPLDWEQDQTNASYSQWVRENDVLIAAYYCKKEEKKTLVMLANGHVMDEEEHTALMAGLEKRPEGLTPEELTLVEIELAKVEVVRKREVQVPFIQHFLLSGDGVLEEPVEWPGRYIPIVPVFGEEVYVDGRRVLNSLIRFSKDDQRMLNFWKSAGTEHVALAPKVPWLATADMVEGYEQDYEDANKKNIAVLYYNKDDDFPGIKPERMMPPQASSGILTEGELSVEGIKATIGIYDAGLGARSNETSGKAIIARQKEGDTSTYTWIDNLGLSIAQVGRVVLDFIPVVYDRERLVRIRGLDDTVSAVKVNEVDAANNAVLNNLTVGKYDVAIESGPSFTTQRAEAREAMLSMTQGNPDFLNKFGDLIFKSMDFPGADEIVKRFLKTLPPELLSEEQRAMLEKENPEGDDQGDQGPPPELVLEMRKMDNEERKTELEAKKIAVDGQKVELEKMKVVGEMQGGAPGAPPSSGLSDEDLTKLITGIAHALKNMNIIAGEPAVQTIPPTPTPGAGE